MSEIISRKEALARGLKRYFTGEPCKSGHVCERYASTTGCAICMRLNANNYAKINRARLSERVRQRYHQKHNINMRPRECRQCGAVFEPSRSNKLNCSKRCNIVFFNSMKRPLLRKQCSSCGNIFETKRSQKIYCSPPCKEVGDLEIRRKSYKPRLVCRKCLNCGSEFMSSKNWRVCSKQCDVEHHRTALDLWRMRNPDKIRNHQKRVKKKSIALRILEEAAKHDPKLAKLMGEINDVVSG